MLLLDFATDCGARPLVMGNGTNLLAPDEGLDRLVIDTSAGLNRVEAGTREHRPGGGRRLPGPGGGFRLPAGAGGAGIRPRHPRHGGRRGVHERRRLRRGDGAGGARRSCSRRRASGRCRRELDFGYRHSSLSDHPEAVVLSAAIWPDARRPGGNPGADAGADGKAQGQPAAGVAQRRQHLQAAGGALCRDADRPMRPEGPDGGRRAGLAKSTRAFCINRGGATFADMTELIPQVQQRVLEQTGVRWSRR